LLLLGATRSLVATFKHVRQGVDPSSPWGGNRRGSAQSSPVQKERKKRKKDYASSKKLLTSIKEKGPLGKKSPFTRKKRGGQ